MLTRARLREDRERRGLLKELSDRATKGPWYYADAADHDDRGFYTSYWSVEGPGGETIHARSIQHDTIERPQDTRDMVECRANAKLIVGLRNHLEDFLSSLSLYATELERVWKLLKEADAALYDITRAMDEGTAIPSSLGWHSVQDARQSVRTYLAQGEK